MSKKLYVGNLPFSTTEEDLKALFSNYGEVISTKVITDRDTNRSRGFGFVEMATDEAAISAISNINDVDYNGRRLVVNEAIDKRPPRQSNQQHTRRTYDNYRERH